MNNKQDQKNLDNHESDVSDIQKNIQDEGQSQKNAKQISKKKRFSLLKIMSFFAVTTIVGLFWVLNTQTGTQVFLSGLSNVAGGSLYVNGVEGNLISPMHIDEIRLASTTSTITLKNIRIDWQLSSLWTRKLKVKTLEISSLKVVSIPSDTKLSLPQNLELPIALQIDKVAIGKIFINTLASNKSEMPQLYLSGLLGSYDANHAQHQLKLSTRSEWGNINLDSVIHSQAPFAINGKFTYQSEKNIQIKPDTNTNLHQSIPDVLVNGEIIGSLSDLTIQALATPIKSSLAGLDISDNKEVNSNKVGTNKVVEKKMTQGEITLHLKPFQSQILQNAKIHLKNFNPLSIHKNAPNAQLSLDIDLENKGIDALALAGKIDIDNAMPLSIDKNGLPFSTMSTMITYSDKHVELSQAKFTLVNGSVKGHVNIQWNGKQLEKVASSFILSDINLLNIDSRLRKTSIQGSVEANNQTPQQVYIKANLNEEKARLKIASNLLLDANGRPIKLSLDELNLSSSNAANLSSLIGKGELSFEGQEKFEFSGAVSQFDPSQWMVAPKGKLAGKVELKGQIKPALQLQLSIPDIQGDLENQSLLGNVNLFWQQDKLLAIDALNLQLAENKISAHGKLDSESDTLFIKLDAPNLAALSPIIKEKISGNLQLDASLKGKLNAPSGTLAIQATNLLVRGGTNIGKLDANIKFGSERAASIQGHLNLYDVKNNISHNSVNARSSNQDQNLIADAVHLTINGQNNDHMIDGEIGFNQSKILIFKAAGGIDIKAPELSWKGQINNFSMAKLFQLQQPMDVVLGAKKIHLGNGLFEGDIGTLQLDSFEWSPGSTLTKGHASQFKLFTLLDLVKPQKTISGDIKLNADWQLQFQDTVKGDVKISRQSGDILIRASDQSTQIIPLGIDALNAHLRFGGLIDGSDAEQVHVSVVASGSRLGQWDAELETQLRYAAGQWQLSDESPLKGVLQAKIPDLQWIGNQLNPDFALKGKLDIDAKIYGQLGHPQYDAKLDGNELELAFASEGLLLQKGELSAQVSDEKIKLTQLKFSNTITSIPRHEKLRDLPWKGQVGDLVASGEVDLKKQTGDILVQWDRFPLLQRKDRWLITTGQAKITQLDKTWSLVGKMKADGGYFELPKFPPPSLSSDVVVKRSVKPRFEDIQVEDETNRIKTKLDMSLDLGANFVFVGRGLDTPLSGTLRLKSSENSPILASGTILAMGGEYEGYGQKLEIERGILNFQGAPSNPSLNIRALRKGLSVEAGVDITGSVAHPVVRLVSEPNVPDADKLSWLVLGRESEQISTNDASLLFSAAGAIFGGDGSRNITKEFVQSLGFDEFSIGSADNGGSSKLPSQTIAGATTVGSSSNDQVVKIGARIKPGIVFSVEKGIADASGALKLSWILSRRVQLVGRYGTDSSFDAKYTFSFN